MYIVEAANFSYCDCKEFSNFEQVSLGRAQEKGGVARRDRMYVTGLRPSLSSAQKLHADIPSNFERALVDLDKIYQENIRQPLQVFQDDAKQDNAKSKSWNDVLQDAAKTWNEAENNVAVLSEELVNVFQDEVFPLNKFTRRKAALKGSSLHLPGLVRAVISDW